MQTSVVLRIIWSLEFLDVAMKNHFFRTSLSLLAIPFAVLAASPVYAQNKALVPVESFTRFAQHGSVVASPDGKFLAAVTPAGERRGLLIFDLTTRKGNVITRYNDMDIGTVRWISNNRLLYSLIDLKSGLGEQSGSGMFAVDKDGKNVKELAPLSSGSDKGNGLYRAFAFDAVVGPDSDEIFATGNFRSGRSVDLYRLNTKTGKGQLLTQDTPGNVAGWLMDEKDAIVGAVTYSDDTNMYGVHHRRADGKYDKLVEFDRDERGWGPVSANSDGTWIIATNLDSDKVRLVKYDPAARKAIETMVEHPKFDLGSNIGSASESGDGEGGEVRPSTLLRNKEKEIIGVRMHLDKETTLWFDKERAQVQASIDAALPGRVNRVTRMGTTKKYLVNSYSDRQPGEYLLFSPEERKLEEIFERQPWINEKQMSERRFITYKARDGREIAAYVTIPNTAQGKAVPLVVLPHGGPWLRNEYWGFEAESQFFASRGYAVVQPEFRGAKGFGFDHFKAGWKQWGLTMQDDLTDAVTHLAKEGIADPSKVCIVGGSYGGYAVSMGLVKDPDLYKCGINVVGVTASQYMNEVTWTDFASSKSAERSLHKVVGHPKTDAAVLAAGNAVEQADKIKAPMLMVYGLLDQRVPLINGERMRDALKKHGKPHEWVVYKDEGHGFLKFENRNDYYKRMEAFLAANIGTK
jgi:dipeptidyl aminopeptidase/acylaminoacyl peptidase